jgi:multidrug efflux pump subunit AcrA (membrane-fusion protein)
MSTAVFARVKPLLKPLLGIAVVAGLATAAVLTIDYWLPPLAQKLAKVTAPPPAGHDHGHGGGGHDEHGEGDEHAHDPEQDPDVLEVSLEAQRTQGIRIAPLLRDDYQRTMPIPGQVAPIGGVTYYDVTTKASGEITRIHALEGQIVKAGDPLFEMSLTHQEAIQHQLELIEALAQLEVANAEIARLEQVERTNPGGLPGARLLQLRYELRHLFHTIDSRRQILTLLGIPLAQVDAMIEQHRHEHTSGGTPSPNAGNAAPLIDVLTIHAPRDESLAAGTAPLFVVEKLAVRQGEHVEVGAALCRLGDYRRLYVEGQAFERDLDVVRRAMAEQWGVSASSGQRDGAAQAIDDLPVVYIDTNIDAATRSARFYVELANTLETPLESMRRPFADWRFRPGQRLELRIPTQQFKDRLVIPPEAVAQDGLEHYVFQVSDNFFVRRRVEIAWRDEQRVVLAENQFVSDGMQLAMSGAYQLQLSLLNRASGPVEHDHHH